MSTADALRTTIRPAIEDDVHELHALIVELAAATEKQHRVVSTPGDFLRFGFTDTPSFHALIAERHGSIVGASVFFYEFSTWLGKPGLYIQDLIVRDELRGGGLGRRLMAETVRVAQRHGATHLRLSVDAKNDAAIRFYRAIGLEASRDERIFHAQGIAFQSLSEHA